MRAILTLKGLLALGLLAGCQVDSNASGDDAGSGGGGGAGGAGGETTPDSGTGGGGVDPDVACNTLSADDCPQRADCVADGQTCRDAEGADCALLREDQCDARPDCAPRADAFGAFADCKPVAEVACALLDEDRCGAREDCAWDGSACGVPVVACEQRADVADCEANACHWWNEACHVGPAPAHCDQPDEASCLAADCEWTPEGCREPEPPPMPCEELAEVACSARMDCRWAGDHCEVDAEGLPCDQLAPEACALRNDCAFDPNTAACIVRPAGACEQLDEFSCVARPDCVADYQQPVDCVPPDGGGGAGDPGDPGGAGAGGAAGGADAPDPGEAAPPAPPIPPCPPDDPNCGEDPPVGCAPVFIGCRAPGPAACDGLTEDVCLQTPGCHLEEGCAPCPPGQVCPAVCEIVLLCTPDAGPSCFDLGPDECVATPGCHVEEGGGACECFIDADGREVCACEAGPNACVPDAPAGCDQLFDANSCFANRNCVWEADPACGGAPVPVPCDCPPDAPNCACDAIIAPVDCGRCVDAQPWDPCAGLPPDVCLQVDGCMLQDVPCDCGFDDAGNPIDCDCVAEPICVQAPPRCGFGDEASCQADPACEWIGFGGEPVPPDCGCPADDPNCGCAGPGVPFPADGFCQERWVDPCGATPVEQCEATPGCGLQEIQPPCLPCDPADPDCPVCEPIQMCVSLDQICGNLDAAACGGDPRCEVFSNDVCQGGGGACPPGVDCPPPEPPVCEVVEYCGPARNRCVNVPEDQCAMMNSCVALTLPDGTFDTCWDANVCDGLNHDQCESHPSCHNEVFDGPCGCFVGPDGREVCECQAGGEFCTNDAGPQPPPGAPCRADADCPPGGFCDAAVGACVFPL